MAGWVSSLPQVPSVHQQAPFSFRIKGTLWLLEAACVVGIHSRDHPCDPLKGRPVNTWPSSGFFFSLDHLFKVIIISCTLNNCEFNLCRTAKKKGKRIREYIETKAQISFAKLLYASSAGRHRAGFTPHKHTSSLLKFTINVAWNVQPGTSQRQSALDAVPAFFPEKRGPLLAPSGTTCCLSTLCTPERPDRLKSNQTLTDDAFTIVIGPNRIAHQGSGNQLMPSLRLIEKTIDYFSSVGKYLTWLLAFLSVFWAVLIPWVKAA